jgi:hypothetical protein
MANNVVPWQTMSLHGKQRRCMANNVVAWQKMSLHGKQRRCMTNNIVDIIYDSKLILLA